jgi:hypothetical protein
MEFLETKTLFDLHILQATPGDIYTHTGCSLQNLESRNCFGGLRISLIWEDTTEIGLKKVGFTQMAPGTVQP